MNLNNVYIRSKSTGRVSMVTEEGWSLMQKNGLASRFIRFDPDEIEPLRPEEIITTTGEPPVFTETITTDQIPVEVQEMGMSADPEDDKDESEEPEDTAPIEEYTPPRRGGRPKKQQINEEEDD
jgi:hypothetical protein